MSFIPDVEYWRSTVTNIKNWSFDVEPVFKVTEDEGRAIVAYVDSLKDRIADLEKEEQAWTTMNGWWAKRILKSYHMNYAKNLRN